MNTTEISKAARMHPFEKAGLGVAPFRIVGSYVSKFQAVPGDPRCPIQPGTCCDYCATGIMDVIAVEGADGRRFKIGRDCALKVGKELAASGDEKIAIAMKRKINAIKLEADHAKADAKIATALEQLERCPRGSLGEDEHRIRFLLKSGRAGRTGRLRGAKMLQAALRAVCS